MAQKMIPCSCTGTYTMKSEYRPNASVSIGAGKTAPIKVPLPIILPKTVQGTQALKKCKKCGGKGQYPDPQDQADLFAQVASKAGGSYAEDFAKQAALVDGGNEHRVYAGDVTHEVGLDFNDHPSYVIDPNAGVRMRGIAGPENLKQGMAMMVPDVSPANSVRGINPLPTLGGNYFLKCSNKFSLFTGALGVDITTNGPLTIDAGITKITGPEITIGSKDGPVALAGDVVRIDGRSIEVTPSDGHLFVKGTMSSSGNLIVGGHAHAESISFCKAECVAKNEISTLSDGPSNIGMSAYWSYYEALPASLLDYASVVLSNASDIRRLQAILTPRILKDLIDRAFNLIYVAIPVELKPTGTVVYDGYELIVLNFPHVHRHPDGAHSHDYRTPNITLYDTSEALRAAQSGISSPAPLMKDTSISIKTFIQAIATATQAFAQAVAAFYDSVKAIKLV